MIIKRQGGTLSQWFVFQYPVFDGVDDGEKVVIGYINNDRYWRDGEVLRTSEIVLLSDTQVETLNTVYKLGEYFSGDENQYDAMLYQHGFNRYGDYESVINKRGI